MTLWGRAAARALAPGRHGRVIAVFERSFYVETDGGIACAGTEAIGAGPLNALLDASVDVALGDCVDAAQSAVRIGHASASAAAVQCWYAPLAASVMPGRDPGISSRLREMASSPAMTVEGRGGLGSLIPTLAAGIVPNHEAEPLHRAARPGLLALRTWIVNGEGEPDEAVAGLLGLGPGLTPSGDDVLGGAMIALRAFCHARRADRLAAWILPRAAAATSAISAAHLACAAEGEGAEAFHRVLLALAGDSEPGPALAMLDGLGHSSGWDMLAGASLVLGALANESAGSF